MEKFGFSLKRENEKLAVLKSPVQEFVTNRLRISSVDFETFNRTFNNLKDKGLVGVNNLRKITEDKKRPLIVDTSFVGLIIEEAFHRLNELRDVNNNSQAEYDFYKNYTDKLEQKFAESWTNLQESYSVFMMTLMNLYTEPPKHQILAPEEVSSVCVPDEPVIDHVEKIQEAPVAEVSRKKKASKGSCYFPVRWAKQPTEKHPLTFFYNITRDLAIHYVAFCLKNRPALDTESVFLTYHKEMGFIATSEYERRQILSKLIYHKEIGWEEGVLPAQCYLIPKNIFSDRLILYLFSSLLIHCKFFDRYSLDIQDYTADMLAEDLCAYFAEHLQAVFTLLIKEGVIYPSKGVISADNIVLSCISHKLIQKGFNKEAYTL